MSSEAGRLLQLNKVLGSFAFGKRIVKRVADAKLFLEAICSQEDHINCVERLIAKQPALDALRLSLRLDTSVAFINQSIAPFLNYLSDPALKQISNGQFLQELLVIIADPPTLWNSIVHLHDTDALNEISTYAFAWLLLELLSLPTHYNIDVLNTARLVTNNGSLLRSASNGTRTFAYQIRKIVQARESSSIVNLDTSGPGGRHDNDFDDYRKIAIYPTSDEFMSSVQPFYRVATVVAEAEPENRVGIHLDNQFRLLREDMLAELRSDIQVLTGKKKGRRSITSLRQLSPVGIDCGEEKKWKQCTIKMHCNLGLEKLVSIPSAGRRRFLKDNPKFLKHQSFGCLFQGNNIIAFATLHREEAGLIAQPPTIALQICGDDAFKRLLLAFKAPGKVDYIQVDTPFFAYEPVLQCLQDMRDLPLAQHLLGATQDEESSTSMPIEKAFIERLKVQGSSSIQPLLNTAKPIDLDPSQMESLISGLSQTVSLIQGPPGTGKSFIGALLAKALYEHSDEKILVLSYTNHALDQFLEDLIDIGIPQEKVVRLGSKSSPRTSSLTLYGRQKTANYRRSNAVWDIVNNLEGLAGDYRNELTAQLQSYVRSGISWKHIRDHLEFSDEDSHFHLALLVPEEEDGMKKVGKKGRKIEEDYLYSRWSRGQDAGIFKQHAGEHQEVWAMDPKSRLLCVRRWINTLHDEQATKVLDLLKRYNRCQKRLSDSLGEKTLHILKEMRIIGCTTTGAAKYAADLQAAAPGIVLVEEAGEILESHVLTAMSSATKQLILIGDHKQLRPKYSNYAISVEKGDGYDLNRSMFERLVLANYPHTTLSKQHRMCPEISSLVRHLTYPNLQDAEKTLNRPPVRGLQNRVIIFNHNYPETNANEIVERRDEGAPSSKSNSFEVDLVLKCVRYLGQQGYGTDKLVILTPYLGQLRLLRDQLSKTTDPVLNDLDSADLRRAGLISDAGASIHNRPINISTIDNYQGEESDIVIASLTRSNDRGDIGFMFAPERLNVLLSRARDALVMIGNAQTFLKSRNSDKAWKPFLEFIDEKGHLYDGLPVQCQQHPKNKALLKEAKDFDVECPDGGCSEPCGTKLNCGLHDCPSKCHQLHDHSKMPCEHLIDFVCLKKHKARRPCYKSKTACAECAEEDRQRERIRKRDERLEADRNAKRAAYARQLAETQAEIDYQKRILKEHREDEDNAKAIAQQKEDLARLKTTTANVQQMNQAPIKTGIASTLASFLSLPGATSSQSKGPQDTVGSDKEDWSSAKKEWEHFKRFEGASNKALDTLMDMIGLEEVKEKFLSIKSKVDTAVRQNIDMKGERFGAALLGNPGTGKTTVARLYAEFLTSVGALPGNEFVETTGSALANEGVSGCKKKLEDIQEKGGGAMFIDEAYQLTSGNNFGGTGVLDYILAEVENLTGKVVFILAGYNKQMEAFFAHNPGLPSRFPHEIQFKDYEDDELLQIFGQKVYKKYNGHMKIEDDMGGLYTRIVARRVGRGRGRDGFGNAREMENTLSRITSRQAVRLQKERRAGTRPDDFLFTSADLLGPEPSEALNRSKAWKDLQKLIGLKAVKQSVQALFGTVQYNYQRELEEKPIVEYSLNKVFLGSPGTGKTSVAKLYGRILADIGLLSNGEVVVKNPSDFVGNVLGASEVTTKGILASTVGKVLLIDEAYGLCGSIGESSTSDPYKTAVIDTIVAEVQSVPGEDRCVLLLGYKDQMEEMFQKVNPGLSRRFPLASAFTFEDFTDEELGKIFDLKLKNISFETTELGKKVAMEVLRRARNRPNFGNAGEVDILLDHAKARQQQRLNEGKGGDPSRLEPIDFDEDFDRGDRADTNVRLLFKGVIGCESIITQLEGYQQTVRSLKELDMDPRAEIPFNFLFRGPPGTGKTSTARKMGKVFYDMGFLAKAEVVECSATNLIGEYVGQTGPKVQKVLENALGRVLFVDEAYRLAEGHFAKEAMDEMVDCLTKEKFAQKLVVILAGYDQDINRLMAQNPGLTSRFPEAVVFEPFKPIDCRGVLTEQLQRRKHDMSKKGKILDLSTLETPTPGFQQQMEEKFERLGNTANWANARDVQTIAKAIFGKLIKSGAMRQQTLIVTEDDICSALDSILAERSQRQEDGDKKLNSLFNGGMIDMTNSELPRPPPKAPTSSFAQETSQAANPPPMETKPIDPPSTVAEVKRDAGVSDAVWEQLQRDKIAAERNKEQYQRLVKEMSETQRKIDTCEQEERAAEQALQQSIKFEAEQVAINEAKRIRELARLKNEMERRAQEELLRELARNQKEEEERRKKEEKAQQKLRTMGICPAGFRWIKQLNGYRCAGGFHFVSDQELGL